MNIPRRPFADIARRWYSTFVVTEGNEEERALLTESARFRTTCCDKIWLVILGLVLIIGVSASTYLLIVEGTHPAPKSFTLVLREQWTPLPHCVNESRLRFPIQRFLLVSTNTTECWNETECSKSMRNIQKTRIETLNETDIPYNFVQAGDERIYEGKGWNCAPDDLDNGSKIFTIALLGKYEDRPPPPRLVKSLEAFLDYAISENHLSTCYLVLQKDSNTKFINDVAFELDRAKGINIC